MAEPTVNTEPLSAEHARLLSDAWSQTTIASTPGHVLDTLGRRRYPQCPIAVTGPYGRSNCGLFFAEVLRRHGFAHIVTWTRVQGTDLHLFGIGMCSGVNVEPSAALITAYLKFLRSTSAAPLGTRCIEWLEVCRS